MRKIYIAIVLFASAFILNACEKETDIFVPDPGQVSGPDTNWYSSITSLMPVIDLQNSLYLSPDIDSAYLGPNADTIHTASGLQCIFPANGCVNALTGLPATGEVYIQSYLLKNSGDFIRMGFPTVTDGNLLVSGGMFFINVQKADSMIQLAKDSALHISYNDTAITEHLNLFDGSYLQNSNAYSWQQDTSKNNTILSGNYGYTIQTNQLRWVNCGHLYPDSLTNNYSSISIRLPASLTNANTLAYIVVNRFRTVMPMSSNVASKQFFADKIPAGLNVTIVTISKDGNFYYLGKQPVATTNTATSITIAPARVSLDAIKTYLNSL